MLQSKWKLGYMRDFKPDLILRQHFSWGKLWQIMWGALQGKYWNKLSMYSVFEYLNSRFCYQNYWYAPKNICNEEHITYEKHISWVVIMPQRITRDQLSLVVLHQSVYFSIKVFTSLLYYNSWELPAN